jgi:2-iminobutanoate/2-iminopropanoate deaminase
LEAAGSDLGKVVRRRIYIIDMKEFRKVDEVWGKWFEEPYPVSTCVQVSGCLECFYVGWLIGLQIGALAKEGALVELEVVAEA